MSTSWGASWGGGLHTFERPRVSVSAARPVVVNHIEHFKIANVDLVFAKGVLQINCARRDAAGVHILSEVDVFALAEGKGQCVPRSAPVLVGHPELVGQLFDRGAGRRKGPVSRHNREGGDGLGLELCREPAPGMSVPRIQTDELVVLGLEAGIGTVCADLNICVGDNED